MQKVIIIGGGPAGMMAALQAARAKNQVEIIEKNKRPGKKLLITGKGRCNLSNYSDTAEHIRNIIDNPEFMYSSLAEFNPYQLYYFFENLDLKLKIERGDRVFPVSNRSADVLKIMERELLKNKVSLIQDEVVKILSSDSKIEGVQLKYGGFKAADKIILAAGGKSYPQTGSDGNGFLLAAQLGHQIIKPEPGLTGLLTAEDWIYQAAGLKLKNVELKLLRNTEVIYSGFGELEIRDGYLDGPLIITASMFIDHNPAEYELVLDLKPALDYNTLDQRLLRDFAKYSNKYFANSLADLLPSKLIPVIISRSKINYQKTVNQITAAEREDLLKLFKKLTLKLKEKKGFKRAIITRGGVSTAEINPQTMESSLISGLYFAGEIIDVAALTGGFNLQIAFATGFKAGNNL
ncbi:NAD(P)/FAD-dependent oxidoreductase [Halanaerobium salsuginis]|uniref:Aminoacetone oxidase family FAD-binding enzyme n=1 Tax=Halanaerobium salsuginis TaxID=29563 RepID=A0A1I4F6H6_9FIRM|nr:aminoacetone oxidase family FAD-binding enzyme [Halanaerobium salsuginis]SFL13595.1 hypothetical protein SAMN02983006_00263 [Halanaerobium salsuginis]